jgi:membrane protease YdiL (CAAX protease family)
MQCNERRAECTTNSIRTQMLDFLLGSTLLFGLPVHALLRSRLSGRTPVDRRQRYRKSTAIIAVLLAILLVNWVSTSRGIAQLGLAAPTTHRALAGSLVAFFVSIIVFSSVIRKSQAELTAAPDDEDEEAMIPQSREEWRAFITLGMVAGFGWEVLYRGFLLFWLSPIVGLWPAAVVSAVAYGLSHGCKTIMRTTGSLVSAFLFTIGYAATGSLWWLIILHTAAPLSIGVIALRRMERTVTAK